MRGNLCFQTYVQEKSSALRRKFGEIDQNFKVPRNHSRLEAIRWDEVEFDFGYTICRTLQKLLSIGYDWVSPEYQPVSMKSHFSRAPSLDVPESQL